MTELLRRGGFHPHKWLTNYPEVLATIPVEDRSPRFLELSENRLPTDRALGVRWDAREDLFRFNALRKEPATTKRTVLSQAFSVWDPRERLIPFSIRSKIILQNLNRLKYGWNDELKEADFFLKNQNCLKLCIFRGYFSAETSHFEKLTCMCFVTRDKMLSECVRTLDKNLKIM